ncbi:MAG: hypothetical protein ACJ0DG_05890 [bacterium]
MTGFLIVLEIAIGPTNSSKSGTLHKLTNIFYTGILSGDLDVHIGVYQS